MSESRPFDAIAFDLLTALLDSWTLWNAIAGSPDIGMRWRREYLRLTYGCGAYQPYEGLVQQAASNTGLDGAKAEALADRWDELQPWPETRPVLTALAERGVRLGVATNCSAALGARAARCVGVELAAIVTSEQAGFYKPRPEPYQVLLQHLGTTPERTLFVAGSPADVPGASAVGMPVFWHNRIGMPEVVSSPQPLHTANTLHPLLDLV